MEDLNKIVSKTTTFFERDIWRIQVETFSPVKGFLIGQLRAAVLAVEGFFQDDCMQRASSLTLYSLLSVVPVLALAFGVAKGFGFQKRLENQLLEQIPGQEEVLLQLVDSANRFLENTQGGLIAGIGVAVLIWSVIKVLSHIENAFNRVWRIEHDRPLSRKFAYYPSIMFIGLILVIMSSSANVFVTTQVTDITKKVALVGMFSPMIFFLLELLPYGLVWLLFTVVYMVMPNTQVKFLPGLLAGIIAGSAYQLAQWAYISFQVGVSRYNAIYGSFAALPLFLIWLQLSWFIVLFGAEISYACQNQKNHEFKREIRDMSRRMHTVLSLLSAHLIIKNFAAGRPLLTAREIALGLSLPIQPIQHVLDDLVGSGAFSKTTSGNHDDAPRYQPAVDTSLLTVHYVIGALARTGTADIPMERTAAYETLTQTLGSLSETLENAPANRLLRDI